MSLSEIQVNDLARPLVGIITKFYADPKNEEDFQKWLYRWEDEFYIIHRDSGTIINWYKHLGRTNTCNKEGFTLADLKELLLLLKEDLKEES